MRLLQLSKLQIAPERQRKEFSPSHIKELKASIVSKGLLHPIVVSEAPDPNGELIPTLVAGECRTRAIRELYEDGLSFSCDQTLVPSGQIPYLLIADLSPADLAEAELEENICRAALTWQEQAAARALIHQVRLMKNPTQSMSETAREVSGMSGKSEIAEQTTIMRSLAVVDPKYRDNPRVKNSKSLKEAHRAVLDIQAASFRQSLYKLGTIKTDHQIILGDCREELLKLSAGSVDIILTDPPYGIKADDKSLSTGHHYDDSPEAALEINRFIIQEAFRLLKPRGLAFIFCDFEHFRDLRDHAARMAFTPWRTPVIWQKGQDGHAPWGQLGFTRTYEIFLFLSKGEKGLKLGGPDIKEFKRPARNERSHAAEKPVALFSHLLSIAGDPGDVVLDPCCGSGPVLEAANAAKMKAIAIERDPDYHALACARLSRAAEAPEEAEIVEEENELLA